MKGTGDVTCLIPLYRSNRHLDLVFDNIESHIVHGLHVICSDQHCLDDAAERIRDRFAGNSLVRVLRSEAGGDWVSNTNLLIAECDTPFMRIMPHDDSCDGASTDFLAQSLRERPELVLSHGWVRAQNEMGKRLNGADEPRFPLRPVDDPLQFSAGFFWDAYFTGAFKSVIRRNVVNGEPLFIRPTKSLRHSERAWLFAYSLLGEFGFSHHASMIKRYWEGSLTHGWPNEASDFIEVADVMVSYAEDFVASQKDRCALRFNLYLNAVNRANWVDGLIVERRPFEQVARLTQRD